MSARHLVSFLCLVAALGAVSAAGGTPPGPDGRIAFSANSSEGVPELYSVNADGTALRRLTWTPQSEQAPAWSPDGTKIAYERAPTGGYYDIWVMNADGSGQTRLTFNGQEYDPAWSPDGTQIAFARPATNGWNLWVMYADGSGQRRVSDVFGNDPAWSPDGSRLAYAGPDGIGVVGIDGSDPHLITGPGTYASGPSWSPDGTRIVFSRNNSAGYPGELYVVNADGSGDHPLTSDGYSNARPSWSPDGSQIVFQRNPAPPFGGWTLWAIGVDGPGLRQVDSAADALGPDWGSSQVVPEPSPPDAPQIRIYSPLDGSFYFPPLQVPAFYICSSYVSAIVSCDGDIPSGAPLDFSQAGTRTFTVRAVDADGRTATASVTYQVLDLAPPQIDIRTPADGATYDVGSRVTVDYSCVDPKGSGVAGCFGDLPVGAPLDTRQPGTYTFHVGAIDNSRNVSHAQVTYTVVDRRPPTIQITSPGDGATYSLGDTVTASYSCASPSGANIVTCAGPVASGGAIDTATAGAKTFTVNASDDRGKVSQTQVTYTVVARPPTIQITSPGDGATYTLGDSVAASYSCASPSGARIVSCAGPAATGGAVDTTTVGAKTFTVKASDDRGLSSSATQPYSVVYAFTGFDSPASAGLLDGAKAGDTVPLKFSLHGNQGLGAVAQATWQQASCTDWSELGGPSLAQGKLTYSASSDRYLDLVSTDPSWKATCRTLDLMLADGIHHAVRVHFTK